MKDFTPKVVLFNCCWGACADTDVIDTANKHNLRTIRTMCSGRIEPTFVFQAFAQGADGVMVAGCHLGDCHYNTGNYKSRRRLTLLKNTLSQLGIEPERLNMEWLPASEAPKLQSAVDGFVDRVTELGPLALNTKATEKSGKAKSFFKNLFLPRIVS